MIIDLVLISTIFIVLLIILLIVTVTDEIVNKGKEFHPLDEFIAQTLSWKRLRLFCEEALLAKFNFESERFSTITTIEGTICLIEKESFKVKEYIIHEGKNRKGTVLATFDPDSWVLDLLDGRTFHLVCQRTPCKRTILGRIIDPSYYEDRFWTWVDPVSQSIIMREENGDTTVRDNVFIESSAKQFTDVLPILILIARHLRRPERKSGYTSSYPTYTYRPDHPSVYIPPSSTYMPPF